MHLRDSNYYRRELFHTKPLFFLIAGLWSASQIIPFFWITELLSHFGVQYMLFFGLCALRFLTTRRWKLSTAALLISLWPAYDMAPFYTANTPPHQPADITVLQWNIYSKNNDMNRVVEVLTQSNAEILALQEVHPSWQKALDQLKHTYPYVAGEQERYRSGLAIFSKHPIEAYNYRWFADRKRALLRADITHPALDEPLSVYNAHPISPVLPERVHRRNNHLMMSAEFIAQDKAPYTMFAADLNTSPFNPAYREFTNALSLHHAQHGHGWLNSWSPIRIHSWPTSVMIDHLFASENLTCVKRHTLGFHGSDHQAIISTFSITP